MNESIFWVLMFLLTVDAACAVLLAYLWIKEPNFFD